MSEKEQERWRWRKEERGAAMKVVNSGIAGCLNHDQKSQYVIAMALLLLADAVDAEPVIENIQS